MEVQLSLESEAILNRLIASGAYKNVSEVLEAGLLRIQNEEESQLELISLLRERVDAAHRGELSTRSFREIIDDAKSQYPM